MLGETKINSAIRDCIAGIYGREAILARIEGFLDAVRENGQLNEAEIRAVEIAVRHILYGMVDTVTCEGDATREPIPIDPRTSKLAGA